VIAVLVPRGPGTAWLPKPLRTKSYWHMVGRFALLGPLIGGLPYAWLLITIPFVYVFGVVPATLAGLLYAAWWSRADNQQPNGLWRATVASISAAAACAFVALIYAPGSPGMPFLFLALHGVPAAAILAGFSRAKGASTKPAVVSVADPLR
jgi:peptidoglycan/LPS O-acetylase OafA/YrhL